MIMNYPVIDMEKTGRTIKALCISRGITARAIQEYMHFSNTQSVYNWFAGKTMPSLDNFYALSLMLQVPMEEMIVPLDIDDAAGQNISGIKFKKIA